MSRPAPTDISDSYRSDANIFSMENCVMRGAEAKIHVNEVPNRTNCTPQRHKMQHHHDQMDHIDTFPCRPWRLFDIRLARNLEQSTQLRGQKKRSLLSFDFHIKTTLILVTTHRAKCQTHFPGRPWHQGVQGTSSALLHTTRAVITTEAKRTPTCV